MFNFGLKSDLRQTALYPWSLFKLNRLTHWGRAMHICVSKFTIIASDNGLSPGRRQAIIWNNAGILSIGLLGTNFSEILIKILTFSFKKMRLKVSSANWRPFCLGLNVLTEVRAWINNYIFSFMWDVITHPCSNFNNSLAKLLLKALWVNTPLDFIWMWLSIHVLISMLVQLRILGKKNQTKKKKKKYQYFHNSAWKIAFGRLYR